MKRMMVSILVLILTFLFVIAVASAEQAVAVGGQVHNEHSYSGDNKIDPPGYVGHGLRVQYERGIDDAGRGMDFTYGFGLDLVRFGKRDNRTMRSGWESAATGLSFVRTYARYTPYFQPFAELALGTSIATDEVTGAIAGALGFETRISDSLYVETYGRVTATETRRHDTYGVLMKWRF